MSPRVGALAVLLALASCASQEVRYGSLFGISSGQLWPIREAANHAVVLVDVTRSDGSVHAESATVINMHQLLTAAGACDDGVHIQLADTHPLRVAAVGPDLCVLQSDTQLGYPLPLAWEYEFTMPLDHKRVVQDPITPWAGRRVTVLWRGHDGLLVQHTARVQSRHNSLDGDRGALTGAYAADMLGAVVYTGRPLGGVVGVVTGEDAEHRPTVAWTRTLHRFLDDADSAYVVGSSSGALAMSH